MDAHYVLTPAGSDARAVATLWWGFLITATVVYVVVTAALWAAIQKARRGRAAATDDARTDARSRLVVGGAMAATVLVLSGMLVSDLLMGKAVLGEREPAGDPVRIRVTAQQFWWQLEYPDAVPDRQVVAANELVVPVDRPIELELQSRDVIHSFWLPALAGKKDLIPGITNTLRFSVDRPGRYEGQCAEFCGYQHSNMRTLLTAVSGRDFEAWKAHQREQGRLPETPEEQRGRQVFETSTCGLCHSVRGTAASASVAPDLTHFGSRPRIAASPMPNTPGFLAAWISSPQQLKPGTNMPGTSLPPDDLQALVAYLGSLK